ncbi:MAG: hypothetical protein P8102_13135 [Gammaproteobacteria bacterium]
MTPFEYFSAMLSLILGLGIAQILAGVGRILQYKGVRMYWVHALWAVLLLHFHFSLWWKFWSVREALQLNYASFVLLLLGPMLLFFSARLLIPDFSDPGEADLSDYYYSVRRIFLSVILVFFINGMFIDNVLTGEHLELTDIASHAESEAIPVLIAILYSQRWVQGAAAVYVAMAAVFSVIAEI